MRAQAQAAELREEVTQGVRAAAAPPTRANYTQAFALLHEHPLQQRVPRIGVR